MTKIDTFPVFLGDESRDPEVLEASYDTTKYESDLVLEVPDPYRNSFDSDPIGALRDIAGKPVSSTLSFFKSVVQLKTWMKRKNPFNKDLLELDFDNEDDTILKYAESAYFKFLPNPSSYRFVHLDLSLNGDFTGISSCYAVADNQAYEEDGVSYVDRDKEYKMDFSIGIKAREGQQIPMYQIRKFLVTLKKRFKMPIREVTADTAFSRGDFFQELTRQGLSVANQSVDRTRGPHLAFKEALLAGKLDLCWNEMMFEELRHLIDNGEKIDHPKAEKDKYGRVVGKDISDSTVGAFYRCKISDKVTSGIKAFTESNKEESQTEVQRVIKRMQKNRSMEGVRKLVGKLY